MNVLDIVDSKNLFKFELDCLNIGKFIGNFIRSLFDLNPCPNGMLIDKCHCAYLYT